MREYTVRRVSGRPDWEKVDTLTIDRPYFDTPKTIRAGAQIAYGEDAFFVHLSTEEKGYRAVEHGPVGSPCEDSCLEFFFCPMENDDRYFNIEFNANGCVYFGLGRDIDTLVRLLPEQDGSVFAERIVRGADGWEIFYEVPYAFIRRFFPDFAATPGRTLRANCYKCADRSAPPHYLAWSETVGEPFTFHKPHCFGLMTLEK